VANQAEKCGGECGSAHARRFAGQRKHEQSGVSAGVDLIISTLFNHAQYSVQWSSLASLKPEPAHQAWASFVGGACSDMVVHGQLSRINGIQYIEYYLLLRVTCPLLLRQV
jgi:hypothetical protein